MTILPQILHDDIRRAVTVMTDNQPPVEVPVDFLRNVILKNIRVFEGLMY